MEHLKLDKTSLIPLHQQLANEIRMAIRSKKNSVCTSPFHALLLDKLINS
jgi:hypothetical protein